MELDEEVITNELSLAASNFKARNYPQSIDLYTQVIRKLLNLTETQVLKIRKWYDLDKPVMGAMCHPKLVSALDSRAAAYEKNQNRDLARKDAEKIVSVDPLSCRGYLRLGKLLMAENKRVDAYKTYQKGVSLIENAIQKQKIDVSAKLLAQLRSQYKNLNWELKVEKTKSPKIDTQRDPSLGKSNTSRGLQGRLDQLLPLKRVSGEPLIPTKRDRQTLDPLQRLPKEVVENIFTYVPISRVLKCHLVCKDWYRGLTSLPKLYQGRFSMKARVTAPEYFQGLKLMKKVSQFSYSNSVGFVGVNSTLNQVHLGRILENIISDSSLKLQRVHILNRDLSIEFLLKKLEKCRWDYSALSSVKSLRLGLNSSMSHDHFIWEIFPNLESLEVLVIDKLHTIRHESLIPKFSDTYQSLLQRCEPGRSVQLRKLVLVNNSHLTRERSPSLTLFGPRSYNPFPPYLRLKMPLLTELNITSYNFLGQTEFFLDFFKDMPLLKSIHFENNGEFPILHLCLTMKECKPKFRLQRLTMREAGRDYATDLDEFEAHDFECLSELEYLDIYGSNLYGKGLLKFVSACGKLKHLNIGHSSHFSFHTDKISTGGMLHFSQLLQLVPHLQSLSLPESDLDSVSMRFLRKDLLELGEKCQLKNLDLSFCQQIDGIGLMNLLRGNRTEPALHLDQLVIDGVALNPKTLKMLKTQGFVDEIQNDQSRMKWRQYGVNSWIIETKTE